MKTVFGIYSQHSLSPLVLLAALAGCGAEPTKQADSPAEQPQQAGDAAAPTSLAFQTLADVPACTAERANTLVYVEDAGQFQVCRGGEWKVIDVGVAAGKAGAVGTAGANGKSSLVTTAAASASDCPAGGKTVRTGLDDDGNGELADTEVDSIATVCNGQTGAKGDAAGVNAFWEHPTSGKHWIYAGLKTSKNDAASRCPADGWRIPTTAEAVSAMNQGVYVALDGPAGAGFVLSYGTDYERVSNVNGAVSAFATASTDEAWVFCVEE